MLDASDKILLRTLRMNNSSAGKLIITYNNGNITIILDYYYIENTKNYILNIYISVDI